MGGDVLEVSGVSSAEQDRLIDLWVAPSIAMLLIILVLSTAVEVWWKRASAGQVTPVQVGH
jgi:hypothetical protein